MRLAKEQDGVQISVVVPVYNESANIGPLLDRLIPVLDGVGSSYEVVFVDDGSRDGTSETVLEAGAANPSVRLVRLSRNFGHQAALVAGLERAVGNIVITMDGDLQHPPELIPELVSAWRGGADVVQTIRRQTADETVFKRATSRGFYHFLSAIANVRVTPGAADFRLMTREALNAFLACGERCRFNRGLVQWIGFETKEIEYDAGVRAAGETKYSIRRMLHLAGDAIFSFSSWPLRLAGLAGAFVSLLAAAYLVFVLWAALFTTIPVPGWSSILASVLILNGVQLIVTWILGEYVGRLYEEAKQRPLYIVRGARGESREGGV